MEWSNRVRDKAGAQVPPLLLFFLEHSDVVDTHRGGER